MGVLSLQELCCRDWTMTIRHVYHEGDKATNFLADRGHDFLIGFQTFRLQSLLYSSL
ncbi:hypothetical protein LINPERPRIM_LOCUS27401 [Linum perenne]